MPLRWYLVTASNPWVAKRYDPEGVREASRKFFDTLFNTYRFFAMYAEVEGWSPVGPDRGTEQGTAFRGMRRGHRPARGARPLAPLPAEPVGRGGWRGARGLPAHPGVPARHRLPERGPLQLVRAPVPRPFLGEGRPRDTRAAFRTLWEALVDGGTSHGPGGTLHGGLAPPGPPPGGGFGPPGALPGDGPKDGWMDDGLEAGDGGGAGPGLAGARRPGGGPDPGAPAPRGAARRGSGSEAPGRGARCAQGRAEREGGSLPGLGRGTRHALGASELPGAGPRFQAGARWRQRRSGSSEARRSRPSGGASRSPSRSAARRSRWSRTGWTWWSRRRVTWW
jgi:hypothetical protein